MKLIDIAVTKVYISNPLDSDCVLHSSSVSLAEYVELMKETFLYNEILEYGVKDDVGYIKYEESYTNEIVILNIFEIVVDR